MTDQVPPELQRLLEARDDAAREEAWAAFLALHSPLLLHTAHRLSPGRDASMDTFAHVLEGLRQDDYRRLRAYAVDRRSKFTTWLVVVAQRLGLDFQRQRYGRARGGPEEREARAVRRRLADLVAEELQPEMVPADAPDQARTLEAEELHAALQAALGGLAPADRLLVTLRFDDELSVPEIARLLGFPTPFHAYRRLKLVLGILRASLRGRGIEGASD